MTAMTNFIKFLPELELPLPTGSRLIRSLGFTPECRRRRLEIKSRAKPENCANCLKNLNLIVSASAVRSSGGQLLPKSFSTGQKLGN
jgi:hypothetical protein